MQDRTASPVTCSGCGSSSFIARQDSLPVCAYCGAPYTPTDPECPRCGERYDPGARRCPSCGAWLTRGCPVCGTLNPLVASQCLVCGQALSVAEAMFERLTTKTPAQLRRMREAGARVKIEERRASQSRMAEMWAADDRRREAREQAQALRARQERLIVTVAIVLVGAAVVVGIILAVAAIGAPAPFS